MKLTLTAAVFAASLACTATASAHNIPMGSAMEQCRQYARDVINDPQTPYTKAKIHAQNAFPGHNHYIRCTVSYDSPQTIPTKDYACVETLDLYYLPEGADRTRMIFMRHITRACSKRVLTGPRPG